MSAVAAPVVPTPAAAPVKKSGGKKKAAGDVPTTTPTTDSTAPATPTVELVVKKAAAPRKTKAAATAAVIAEGVAPVTVVPTADTTGAADAPAGETENADTAPASAEPVRRKTQVSRDDVLANNKEIESQFKALLLAVKEKKIQGVTKIIESLKKQATKAGLDSIRAVDQAKKSSRRKAPTNPATGESKKPSGLDKPIMLSADFARVINVDPAVPMTRGNAIHKLYYDYISARGLKTPGNGRHLNPDATVLALLQGWNGTDALNYITIRAYLKHHFTALPETAAAPAVSATA